MDPAGLLGLVLLWLFGSKGGATAPPGRTEPPPYVPYRPPLPEPSPWPLVVPTDLPRFPGAGWEFDEPPPPDVRQRAAQLVEQLWKTGTGTSKTEQTGGRWITYQAQIVRSGKRGVVAYRLARKQGNLPATSPAATSSSATPGLRNSAPGYVPYRPPLPGAAPPVQVMPGAPPMIARPLPSIPSLLALPELRRGAGLPPKAPDPNVRILQQKLGINADGQFGGGTETAVIEFQRRTGLAPNQSNAQLKARGFGVVKKATWTKLFDVRSGP